MAVENEIASSLMIQSDVKGYRSLSANDSSTPFSTHSGLCWSSYPAHLTAKARGRRIYRISAIDRSDSSDVRDFITLNVSHFLANICAVQWVS